MVGGLLKGVQFQHLKADGTNYPVAAGTGDSPTSDAIDTQNFNEILILGVIGAMVATGTLDFKLQGSNVLGSGYVDIAGSKISQAVAANDANTIFGWDIMRIQYRYIKVVLTRATANVTIQSLVAMKYSGYKQPRTQTTGSAQFVTASSGINFLYDPIAGTP